VKDIIDLIALPRQKRRCAFIKKDTPSIMNTFFSNKTNIEPITGIEIESPLEPISHHFRSIMNNNLPPFESPRYYTPPGRPHTGSVDLSFRTLPGPKDVICGRDKVAYNNPGNRCFRVAINANIKNYLNAKTRMDRTEMILGLVRELRFEGVRFLKRKGAEFVELDEQQFRNKVGHALR
jgi:hypothetical protein